MSYQTLINTYNGEDLLTITEYKKLGCGLFPDQKECEHEKRSCFSCQNTLKHGRPVHFEYSPDTLPNWKYGRCLNEKGHVCSSEVNKPPVM